MDTHDPRTRLPRNHWVAVALVCLAATLPYLSTLRDYFVNDDFGVVQLLSRKPLGYFPRWFVTSWMDGIWGYTPDEVRPFPALSYQLASMAAPTWPVPNHVINIAFHAANGLLVLAVAETAAGLGLAAATFAALVFVLLPVHAESVAWITGRVDTFPAFFYLASFLLYARWRAGAGERAYAGSLVLFFVALFSKQNTITMVATLALYDVIVLRRRVRWSEIGPYLPYVAMTIGYLLLRYVLFGEVARERSLSASGVAVAGHFIDRHLAHVVFGHVNGGTLLAWLAVAGLIALACWWASRRPAGTAPRAWTVVVYFGPVWWIIGVAPVLVALYESPRHVYLAAVGWAILLGLVFDIAWRSSTTRPSRAAVLAAAGLVLVAYSVPLHAVVTRWNRASALSHQMVGDLEREAMSAPPGALLIVGAPASSWEWALPFAARPPFAGADLTTRAFLVTPMKLHCCRHLWADHTRAQISAWAQQREPGPILALAWDAETGARFRVTEQQYPGLRAIVLALPQTGSPEAMDQALLRFVAQVVRGYPVGE